MEGRGQGGKGARGGREGEGGRGEGEGGRGGKWKMAGNSKNGGKFETSSTKNCLVGGCVRLVYRGGIGPAINRPEVHQAGIEPATWGSTVPRSTTELLVVGQYGREISLL